MGAMQTEYCAMRVFLTGSTGFIGSAIISALLAKGHSVLGLTRSGVGAQALANAGAEAHLGDIENLNSLRAGAAACDAVIHTAFDHNFANFAENCQKDRRAIAALGSALAGSNRPLLITSSTAMGARAPGQMADEDSFNATSPNPRVASELAGNLLLDDGINISTIRLSQIHNTRKQGLVSDVIELARKKGVSAYIGDGTNCWSATHLNDAARLYVLALERGTLGARYHATAEAGIPFRTIAEAIARRLDIPTLSIAPDRAAEHFTWLAAFAGKDMSAASSKTRERLGWLPDGPTLLEDIANLHNPT